MREWYVYILRCSDDTLYTGVATDLQRRLHEHNHTTRGARYTRSRRPVELVYSERLDSHSSACKREHEIKRLSRNAKVTLISRRAIG